METPPISSSPSVSNEIDLLNCEILELKACVALLVTRLTELADDYDINADMDSMYGPSIRTQKWSWPCDPPVPAPTPAPVPAPPSTTSSKCSSMTKKGNQCTRNIVSNGRCSIHK